MMHEVDECRSTVCGVLREPPEPSKGAIDECRVQVGVEENHAEVHLVQ